MKKIIFIIFSIMFLSGCSVEYNLSFTDDKLSENINFNIDKSDTESIDYLKSYYGYAIYDAIGSSQYNINYNENENYFRASYDFIYTLDNFNRAYYINQCFESVGFVKDGDNYIISTSEGFNCMLFDYVKADNFIVTISTNHEVIENNADNVKNDSYTWNINDNNAISKKIYIKFGSIKKKSFWDILKENLISIIFVITLLIVGIIFTLYIIIKSKKNNEI